MIPPTVLNVLTFFPLNGGCSEGPCLDAFKFFFKNICRYLSELHATENCCTKQMRWAIADK